MKKFLLSAALALGMVCCPPLLSAQNAYSIYPVPQQISYSGGNVCFTDEVEVICSDAIDEATRNRAREVLTAHGLTPLFLSASTGNVKTVLLLGVAGNNDEPNTMVDVLGIAKDVLTTPGKYDRHLISLKEASEGEGLMIILGEHTDAVFHGLATLEQMLDQPFVIGTLGPRDLGWRAMPPLRLLIGSWLDTRPTGDGHVWMPPGLGLPLVAVTALGLLRRPRDPLLLTGLALTALATTLFPWSAPTVQRSFLASFQFPWRFLLLGTALLSVAGGVTLAETVGSDWRRQRRWLPWLAVACGVIWLSNVAQNARRTTWRVQEAARLDSPEAGTLHYLPAVLSEDAVRRRLPLGAVTLAGTTDGGVIETDAGGVLTLRTSGGAGTLELPRVAYLGYEAVAPDGTRCPVGRSAAGFLTVRVPPEPCRLRIRYAGTTLQHLTALVSLVSAALAALVWAARHTHTTAIDI